MRTAFAFAFSNFRFSAIHRRDLAKHVRAEVIKRIEADLGNIKGEYDDGAASSLRVKKAEIEKVCTALESTIETLDHTHALALQSIQAFGIYSSGFTIAELGELLVYYREAARRARDEIVVTRRGEDAATRIALVIANRLREAGHYLNAARKGTFVAVSSIALEAMGIHKAGALNDVRRVLQLIEKRTS